MAAGPPVVRRRESRRISKYQGRRFSEILLEKPRAPFGKIPKSLWKNSGLPLEKFQNAFGKIPNSRWENSGFQNPQDVPRRGPIPPLKTDFGKIPNSPGKNSGICLENIWTPSKQIWAVGQALPADSRTVPRAGGLGARLPLRP